MKSDEYIKENKVSDVNDIDLEKTAMQMVVSVEECLLI